MFAIRALDLFRRLFLVFPEVSVEERCSIVAMIRPRQLHRRLRLDRLHSVRQSVHALAHLVPENRRVGPAWLHSQ